LGGCMQSLFLALQDFGGPGFQVPEVSISKIIINTLY
jgi:hypothetical protein